jgi:hypothetical protein
MTPKSFNDSIQLAKKKVSLKTVTKSKDIRTKEDNSECVLRLKYDNKFIVWTENHPNDPEPKDTPNFQTTISGKKVKRTPVSDPPVETFKITFLFTLSVIYPCKKFSIISYISNLALIQLNHR